MVDLDDSDIIELKEFLVALTVAHALGLISLSDSQKVATEGQENKMITKTSLITANDVKNVCNLILSAYLLFDPTGKGFITKKGVEQMIKKGKSKSKEEGNRNLLLNESRWKEMVRLSLLLCQEVIFSHRGLVSSLLNRIGIQTGKLIFPSLFRRFLDGLI